RFRLYQTVSVSDFLGAFQVSAFAFPFPAVPTLPDPFSVPFPVGIHFQWPLDGPSAYSRLAALFRRVRLYQKLLTGLTGRSVLTNREALLGIAFTRSS
ncbi:hypothetical protein ACFRDV_40950, partial [Streptomyces fagopyri]|uniref:hypothetical protein n=1 Tax=Streptomyces fagopyri TaxID=2662397 RepID=UPI0036BF836B